MQIRKAKLEDVPTLLNMAKDMWAEAQQSNYPMNDEKVARLFTFMVDDPSAIFIVAEDKEDGIVGAFMGGVAPHYFGDQLMSYDFGLYVTPKHRKGWTGPMLVKAYVDTARAMGVAECGIGNTTGIKSEAVAAMYEKAGFVKVGYNFRMNLRG